MRRKEAEEEKDRKEEDDIKAMDGQLEKQRHIEREVDATKRGRIQG